MTKYLFGKNSSGDIVSVYDLIDQPQESWGIISCLGCGELLVPKVKGKIMVPHFAHKKLQECHGETYLHKLGKIMFLELYKDSLANNIPFFIDVSYSKKCTKYDHLNVTPAKDCNLGCSIKVFDLTDYYQEIVLEERDGKFIPDLLLRSQKKPDEKIYIEIAVTSFLSEKKQRSGTRVIEIRLDSDRDIIPIKNRHITTNDALFIGFDQASHSIVDTECQCTDKNHFVFYVYASGKAFLKESTMAAISHDLRSKNIIYHKVLLPLSRTAVDLEMIEGYYVSPLDKREMFLDELLKASENGVKVKNCFLCKYHAANIFDSGVYCRAKKMSCSSSFAVECDWFRIP